MRAGTLLTRGKHVYDCIISSHESERSCIVVGVSILSIGLWKCSQSMFFHLHLLIDVLISIEKEHGR
jgi:hypothetical protein